jgi:phage gpG-like protein
MTDISVTIDDKQLIDTLESMGHIASDAINFSRLGLKVKQNILRRTKDGVDINKTAFKPYSPSYFIQKSVTHTDTTVNLQNSNRMLASIQVSANDNSSMLFFADAENSEKALVHNSGINGMPKREFFGVNSDDEAEVYDIAISDIRQFLGSL